MARCLYHDGCLFENFKYHNQSDAVHKPVCLLMCLFNDPLVLNEKLQPSALHLKSLTSECVSICVRTTFS